MRAPFLSYFQYLQEYQEKNPFGSSLKSISEKKWSIVLTATNISHRLFVGQVFNEVDDRGKTNYADREREREARNPARKVHSEGETRARQKRRDLTPR